MGSNRKLHSSALTWDSAVRWIVGERGESCCVARYSAIQVSASSTACEGSMKRTAISRVRLSCRASSMLIANHPLCPRTFRNPAMTCSCFWATPRLKARPLSGIEEHPFLSRNRSTSDLQGQSRLALPLFSRRGRATWGHTSATSNSCASRDR